MENAAVWLIVGCLFFYTCSIECQTDTGDFDNVEFAKNMGLYYELMTPIQHVNGAWRTTIFLETEGLHAFLPLYLRRWEQVAAQCRIMFGNNCVRSPGYPQLLRKMASAEDLLEELQGAIGKLEEHSRAHSPEYLPASIHRKRRTVPWFGFIGKLAGPTLGVLTYEDGERYERVM